MNDLNKIYQKIKTTNPKIDDGKARQQAWVLRDKMLFENSAVSSSSAAGAGAGAGGGRTYERRIQDASVNDYVESGYIDNYFV